MEILSIVDGCVSYFKKFPTSAAEFRRNAVADAYLQHMTRPESRLGRLRFKKNNAWHTLSYNTVLKTITELTQNNLSPVDVRAALTWGEEEITTLVLDKVMLHSVVCTHNDWE
jgi:hypothetical protein